LFVASAELDRAAAYRLFISAVIPRPIAWVGSVAADGTDNLAPYSYFMGVSSVPPMLAFAAARLRDGAHKHTARNVLATGEFTVSIAEEPLLDTMHQTSAAYADSEFDAVGIARGTSVHIRAPRVAAARVAMECVLRQHHEVGNSTLFVGEVIGWFVADELWNHGEVDLSGFRPLGRLGGDAYTTLGTVHRRPPAKV